MSISVPLATGDFIEVRLVGTLHGQVCINTFRYLVDRSSGSGAFDLTPLEEAFVDTVWAALREVMSAEYVGAKIFMQKIWPVRYVSDELVPTDRTGAVAGQSLPSVVAFCFRRRMAVAGRTNRGRIFLPGVPVASETDSRVSSAVLASAEMADAIEHQEDQLTSGVVTLTPHLIVPGVESNYLDRGRITEVTVDDILRVQRRREVGRGI